MITSHKRGRGEGGGGGMRGEGARMASTDDGTMVVPVRSPRAVMT